MFRSQKPLSETGDLRRPFLHTVWYAKLEGSAIAHYPENRNNLNVVFRTGKVNEGSPVTLSDYRPTKEKIRAPSRDLH